MTTLATDDFNRANEDPLAGNWTGVGSTPLPRLVSNQFAGPSTDHARHCYRNDVTPANDQWSQITVTTAGTNNDWGPGVRWATGATTGYFIDHFPGSEGLYKVVAGTFTQIASGAATNYAVSDVLYCEAQGTTILCKINGSTDASVTDSSIASGRLGIFAFTNDARGDTYSGGDFSSAAFTKMVGGTGPGMRLAGQGALAG